MADDEELNTAKLDELKSALDDLKIVDISRKPKGLSADLKVSADFAGKDKTEPWSRLQDKGFYPGPTARTARWSCSPTTASSAS